MPRSGLSTLNSRAVQAPRPLSTESRGPNKAQQGPLKCPDRQPHSRAISACWVRLHFFFALLVSLPPFPDTREPLPAVQTTSFQGYAVAFAWCLHFGGPQPHMRKDVGCRRVVT